MEKEVEEVEVKGMELKVSNLEEKVEEEMEEEGVAVNELDSEEERGEVKV